VHQPDAGGIDAGRGQAMAGDLLQWQNNSLTYLYGKDFQVNPRIQQTVTFEHADAWKYGDNFLFVDKIFYNGKDENVGSNTYYGEFSPRLSFGKIFDQKLEFGPIKDVLLAMTYEFGEGDTESYLIGPVSTWPSRFRLLPVELLPAPHRRQPSG
jgi:nucleoside-specific outer membrane channel protein Tsx